MSPHVDENAGVPATTSGIRHAPLTGHRLGRYHIGDRLGSGGAASVYLALLRGPHDWERVVALKIVHEHLLDQHDFVSMFLDEANLAVRLTHPNVVHSYELGHEGPWLFLAMEYLHGQPLSALLTKAKESGQELPVDVMAWVGAEAAKGLAYAHDLPADDGTPLNIVHRDVSPHNVFLTYDGQVKLIDFGIARSTRRITETGLGQVKGKFRYMAPEQLMGNAFDHRADVFSLGATLYEATVGQRPFPADDEAEALACLVTEDVPKPTEIRTGYPAALSDILLGALTREPEDRYQGAHELARDLKRFATSSTESDLSSRLAALLEESFRTERARQEEALERLRELPQEASGVIHSAETERPAAPPRGPRKGRAAIFVATALAAIAAATGFSLSPSDSGKAAHEAPPSAESEPSPVPPPDEHVTLNVTVQPKTSATISIDGKVVQKRPARVELSRGEDPVAIVVTAEGYETAHLEAVPDRDHFIVVPLIPKAPPAPSSEPAASASAKPIEPRPPRTAPAPTPSIETPSTKPPDVPEPSQPSRDPLVTDYPF